MLRIFMSLALTCLLTGVIATASDNTKTATNNQGQQATTNNTGNNQGQQATITKVDAKNQTVTVRMKDKNGRENNRTFKLTGDIRYFDSTGKAIAVDLFRSGDEVLVVEAEGHLRSLQHHANTGGTTQVSQQSGNTGIKSGQTDQSFVKAATEIDLTEMKLGKLAESQAQTPAVKKYGERLVTDHKKMNVDLRHIAKAQGVAMPTNLDQKHQEFFDKLSQVKGMQFDRTFTKDMVAGHERAIKRFEAEAKSGQDAAIKAFAEKWLPTLREHRDLAMKAQKEVGTAGNR